MFNLKKFRYDNGLSQEALGKKLGVTKQHISKIERGKANLTPEKFNILVNEYGVSLQSQQEKQENCIDIPVRGEIKASMGYGITVYDESITATYSISKQLANDLNINLSSAEIIFGSGNSMCPTIEGGDSLLIDKSKKEINDGKIYCIRYDGQLLTKRLQKLSKTKIKILSDNKDYEPVLINLTEDIDFEIIGEVKWFGRILK